MAEVALLVLVILIALATWVRLAGTLPQDVKDEEPTLDVQNHRGDG